MGGGNFLSIVFQWLMIITVEEQLELFGTQLTKLSCKYDNLHTPTVANLTR